MEGKTNMRKRGGYRSPYFEKERVDLRRNHIMRSGNALRQNVPQQSQTRTDNARFVEIVSTDRRTSEEGYDRRERYGGHSNSPRAESSAGIRGVITDRSRGPKRKYDDGRSYLEGLRLHSSRMGKERSRLHGDVEEDYDSILNHALDRINTDGRRKYDDQCFERDNVSQSVSQKASWAEEYGELNCTPGRNTGSPPLPKGRRSSDDRTSIGQEKRKTRDMKRRLGQRNKSSKQGFRRNSQHKDIKYQNNQARRSEQNRMGTTMKTRQDLARRNRRDCDDRADNYYEEPIYSSAKSPNRHDLDKPSYTKTEDLNDKGFYTGGRQSSYYQDHQKQRRSEVTAVSEFRGYVHDTDIVDGHHHDVIREDRLKMFSKEEKEDLASSILCTICEKFDGNTDLKALNTRLVASRIVEFSDTRSLYQFLKEYEVFRIDGQTKVDEDAVEDGEVEDIPDEDSFIVTAKPSLHLCIRHSVKAGSCTEGCKTLHICKYFIMSQCFIETSGKTCIFGHHMDTEHNRAVMRQALIHMFPASVLLQLKYRNSTTVPIVCTFYNSSRCRNTSCQFLHVCNKYILGNCESGLSCDLSHDICSNQALPILDRYGMAPQNELMKQDVIATFRNIFASQNADQHTKVIKTAKRQEPSVNSKITNASEDNIELDATEGEDVETSSPWDWRWAWQTEDGRWTDVSDSHSFEEKFREYVQARKMQFSINNKISEINFATMKGRILGESPLSFKRVKKERFEDKPKDQTENL